LDLDNAVLFGNQTAILQSPSQRGLTAKSFKHRKTYIASRWKYLNHHKWFERLRAALQGFLNQHHDILLMGDFNEDLETNIDGLRSVTTGLIDLMQIKIGHKKFSTHIDGQTWIDFAFATPRVVEACTHAGYEPFRHRFETDHWVFFLDLDNPVLFGNQTAILQSPSQRGLTSKSF
jgi:hypothetical protein